MKQISKDWVESWRSNNADAAASAPSRRGAQQGVPSPCTTSRWTNEKICCGRGRRLLHAVRRRKVDDETIAIVRTDVAGNDRRQCGCAGAVTD